tara:strand:+ start:1050 stop:1886 length:837 start_codon:yes stop_codon:yes gene_type:complete
VANQRRNREIAEMVHAVLPSTIINADTVVVEAVDLDTSELDTRIRQLENQIKGMKAQHKKEIKGYQANVKDTMDLLTPFFERGWIRASEADVGGDNFRFSYDIPANPDPKDLEYRGKRITREEILMLGKAKRVADSVRMRCEAMGDLEFPCSLCGLPLGGNRIGHNPFPFTSFASERYNDADGDYGLLRCCDFCNDAVVEPGREELVLAGEFWYEEPYFKTEIKRQNALFIAKYQDLAEEIAQRKIARWWRKRQDKCVWTTTDLDAAHSVQVDLTGWF